MEFLEEILLQEKPSILIRNNSDKIFELIPELRTCKDFAQNNIWHIYDVYEHILHVVDGVPNIPELRIAALFHDIGKPYVYKEDENGVGHFFGHWDKSNEIFSKYADRYSLDENSKSLISNLILYHDVNIDKLDNEELKEIITIFDKKGIKMLFKLKKSDLQAQNKKFHYLLETYSKQESELLKLK